MATNVFIWFLSYDSKIIYLGIVILHYLFYIMLPTLFKEVSNFFMFVKMVYASLWETMVTNLFQHPPKLFGFFRNISVYERFKNDGVDSNLWKYLVLICIKW